MSDESRPARKAGTERGSTGREVGSTDGRRHYGPGVDRRTLLRGLSTVALLGSVAGASAAGGRDSATGRRRRGRETTTGSGDGSAGDGANESADGPAQTPTTHEVAMTDGPAYDPASLTIAPGDTVVWTTVGASAHTVTAYEDAIPGEAAYFASGGYDSESAARDGWRGDGAVATDESYEYTFETTGTYEYFCVPHEGAGMKGTIEVRAGAGETAATGPAVPQAAETVTVATTATMVGTLGLAYLFEKYGATTGPE